MSRIKWVERPPIKMQVSKEIAQNQLTGFGASHLLQRHRDSPDGRLKGRWKRTAWDGESCTVSSTSTLGGGRVETGLLTSETSFNGNDMENLLLLPVWEVSLTHPRARDPLVFHGIESSVPRTQLYSLQYIMPGARHKNPSLGPFYMGS